MEVFDFGFTAVNEDELQHVQASKDLASTAQERLDKLYQAVQPLLKNLKKNPEKEYILWPDRLQKVEAFEQHLKEIYEGG